MLKSISGSETTNLDSAIFSPAVPSLSLREQEDLLPPERETIELVQYYHEVFVNTPDFAEYQARRR